MAYQDLTAEHILRYLEKYRDYVRITSDKDGYIIESEMSYSSWWGLDTSPPMQLKISCRRPMMGDRHEAKVVLDNTWEYTFQTSFIRAWLESEHYRRKVAKQNEFISAVNSGASKA